MTRRYNSQFAGIISAIFISLALSSPDATADSSFNCKTAHSADEKAVCANEFLASMDALIAKSYLTSDPRFADKEVVGRAFLHDRAACGSDAVCIAGVQWGMLVDYDGSRFGALPAWVERYLLAGLERRAEKLAAEQPQKQNKFPAVPGECAMTHIQTITTRGGEELKDDNEGDGVRVTFESGVSLVDYNRHYGLITDFKFVKAKDVVALCLVSIPHDCPKGDDRGKTYFVYDATNFPKTDWLMGDSQHSCGGE